MPTTLRRRPPSAGSGLLLALVLAGCGQGTRISRVEGAMDGTRAPTTRIVHDAEAEYARLASIAGSLETKDTIVAWDAAAAWAARARAIGAVVPSAAEIAAERRRALIGLAERSYAAGREAEARRAWHAALQAYEDARTFVPDHRDTAERIAAAWRGAADDDLANGRYHAALRALVASDAVSPSAGTRARAAALRVALAKSDLQRGFCRAAWEGLAAAGASGPDLEAARRCARIELVLPPSTGARFGSLPADRVGAVLDAALVAALRGRASPHVRLRTPEAVTSLPNGRLADATPAAPLDPADGVRYEVTVDLSREALRVAEDRSGAPAVDAVIPWTGDAAGLASATDASAPEAGLILPMARSWAARAADLVLEAVDRPVESPDPPSLVIPDVPPPEPPSDGAATGEPI